MNVSDGMNYAPKGKPQPVVKPGEFVFSAVRLDHGHIYGMCNGLTEAGGTLKYVYDPDEKKVEAFLKAFPQAKAARSEEEALGDPETHMIAGAAITSERCALGLRAMNAGKDYFTDKAPFTTLEQLESAKKAVALARKNGHKVYICTGCSKAEISQRDLPELDGMIGANGGYIEDAGEVVMHQSLTVDQVKHIVDWCNGRQLGFYLEANSGMYINDYFVQQAPATMRAYAMGKGADEEQAQQAADSFIGGMTRTDDLYRDDVNKVSFILSSYQDHLDSKVEFPSLEANTWGGKGELALFGDLGPTGITKRHAIEVLLETV